jgi:hypothetical protein
MVKDWDSEKQKKKNGNSRNSNEINATSCMYEPVETSNFCKSGQKTYCLQTIASAMADSAAAQLREGIHLFFTSIPMCQRRQSGRDHPQI